MALPKEGTLRALFDIASIVRYVFGVGLRKLGSLKRLQVREGEAVPVMLPAIGVEWEVVLHFPYLVTVVGTIVSRWQ